MIQIVREAKLIDEAIHTVASVLGVDLGDHHERSGVGRIGALQGSEPALELRMAGDQRRDGLLRALRERSAVRQEDRSQGIGRVVLERHELRPYGGSAP